jgi:hypothetical protein
MPNNLTSRELSYLEDNLDAELLLVKKFTTFAEQCQDSTLKNTCLKIADKHAGHYDKLLQYLNE